MRAFIADDLPEDIKEIVYKRTPKFYGIKYVKKQNLHITLKFLGDVDDNKINFYKKILDSTNLNEIQVRLTNFGFFPSKNFIKVVWVGVEGDFSVVNKLDVKDFVPHITVGRVKRKLEKEEIEKFEKVKFDNEFEIRYLTIYKSTLTSTGPIYEVIKRYNL